MKTKIRSLILLIVFTVSVALFESCYTNKKGVVPCPTWGQINQIQNQSIQDIPVVD